MPDKIRILIVFLLQAGLGRKYSHNYEEVRSRRAFYENVKVIENHNKLYKDGKVSYRLRTNVMADLKPKSYLEKYVRLVNSQRYKDSDPIDNMVSSGLLNYENLPNEIDWRDKGFLMTADNQGQCGSCYAFSIVRSMEGQVFKRTGKLFKLSVQQVVDCSIKTGNKGCTGGSLRNTLRYLEETGGLMRHDDYTYQERQGKCQFIETLSIVNVTTWSILPPKDEEALKAAVALIGPIAVSLNASPNTFQLYGDGVYDDDNCNDLQVNHAMLVVGYTDDYWILKNWWGPNWGENGYMKLKRGKNLCGISNYAAYAVV
ncbi:procathepsin L [Condylostylus longicornis]|uniref:procathepsin L n=1 Tax=Condylostylus longicornis TaxID=2530218 RepID=UPI00244DFCDB|nr:procathepsin L [Condylostylus longicornis]